MNFFPSCRIQLKSDSSWTVRQLRVNKAQERLTAAANHNHSPSPNTRFFKNSNNNYTNLTTTTKDHQLIEAAYVSTKTKFVNTIRAR